MEIDIRVGSVGQKDNNSFAKRPGFDIEERGTGPAANSWLPVLTFFCDSEAEAEKAAKIFEQALENVTASKVHRSNFT